MSILEWLGFSTGGSGAAGEVGETQTVRKIVQELDTLPPERARFVACFAYILSRVARADMSISEEETHAMERIVTRYGGLPATQAMVVVQMAKTQALMFGGTENFLVVREFNRIATRDQKLALLDCLYAVSAADLDVSTVEDGVIRQIAGELMLDHSDLVAARGKVREYLSVLKKPESRKH